MSNDPQRDAQLRAKALSRWEGEGGALIIPNQDEILDGVALRLLARLGAAVLESWDELPADVQQRIDLRVQTLGSGADRLRARDNLARFVERTAS